MVIRVKGPPVPCNDGDPHDINLKTTTRRYHVYACTKCGMTKAIRSPWNEQTWRTAYWWIEREDEAKRKEAEG